MIRQLDWKVDVHPMLSEISAHPELWNEYSLRTDRYNTPHSEVSDIWVRFNPWSNFDGDGVNFTMGEHESEWYPGVTKIPSVKAAAHRLCDHVGGMRLGGVLITRIPPGGEVKPHIDSGWHAEYYEKYAIQLKGNKDQGFYFEDAELHPEVGDVYTFDNSKLHWVRNDSNEERMTLIVCIRRKA